MFGAAERQARSPDADSIAAFLERKALLSGAQSNDQLSVADHAHQARAAIAPQKQTSSLAVHPTVPLTGLWYGW